MLRSNRPLSKPPLSKPLNKPSMPVKNIQDLIDKHTENKTILVITESHNGTEIITHKWSFGGFVNRPPTLITGEFDEIIKNIPIFSKNLSEVFNPNVEYSIGSIELINVNGELDDLMNNGFDLQPISIYLGSPDWLFNEFKLIHKGFITNDGLKQKSKKKYILNFVDNLLSLNNPLQRSRFSDNSAEDEIIPTCLGVCFNVEPVLVDANNQEYQFDEYNIDEVLEMRQNGNPVMNYKIGEIGDERLYIDQGKIRTTSNTGSDVLTFDIIGRKVNLTTFSPDINGTAITTCSDILKHVIINKTTLTYNDIDDIAFDTHKTNVPYDVGFYTKIDHKIIDLYGELLSSVISFGNINVNTGKLGIFEYVLPIKTDTPDHILTKSDYVYDSIDIVNNVIPSKKITIGYKKNNKIQTSNLAGILTLDEIKLCGLEYSSVSSSSEIYNSDIASIEWQNNNTIRYTFVDEILVTVDAGNILNSFNNLKENNGNFIISASDPGLNKYYVEVINNNIIDESYDELNPNGFADITIGKHLSISEKPMIPTLLADKYDANLIADEILDIFSNGVQEIKINKIIAKSFLYDIGESVKIETDELNLEDSVCLIIGISNNYKDGTGVLNVLRRIDE